MSVSTVAAEADATKIDFLLEYYRSAREELLMRVKARDNWLKGQLFSQGAILALSQGVEVSGVGTKAQDSQPAVLIIAVALSFVLACFYYVEDTLVAGLSRYTAYVSRAEWKLRGGPFIRTTAGSRQIERFFTHGGLQLRLSGQIAAFWVLPLILFVLRLNSTQFKNEGGWQTVEIILDVIMLLAILGITCFVFFYRRRSGLLVELLTKDLEEAEPGKVDTNDIIQMIVSKKQTS
jgi:hypothetical protein